MSKSKTIYACTHCGAQSPKWAGQCSDCGAWNSMTEELQASTDKNRNPRFAGYAASD